MLDYIAAGASIRHARSPHVVRLSRFLAFILDNMLGSAKYDEAVDDEDAP